MNNSDTQSIQLSPDLLNPMASPIFPKKELDPSIRELVSQTAPGFDINKAIDNALLAINTTGDDENPSAGSSLTFNPARMASDYNGLYRARTALIPYEYGKMVYSSNDLLWTIINQLAHKVACFCKPQTSVNDVGYKLILRDPRKFKTLPIEKQKQLWLRSAELRDLLYNTGYVNENDQSNRPKLPEYIISVIKDGLLAGWTMTEIINDTAYNKPYCFKAVDSATMYLPPFNTEMALKLAQKSYQLLANNHGQDLQFLHVLEKLATAPQNFSYVQVIDGIVYTAFEKERLICETFFPSNDVNDAGYPRPPLDAIVKALSSNSNIATHNNLVFANGRASKGFFVIKSSGTIQENVLQRIRQQFAANINGVERSFRTPVFGIGVNDDISWMPMDTANDMQFQYLMEITSRVVMAAYGMSPEELPGYSHLVRPRPGQALPESDTFFNSTDGKGTGFRFVLEKVQYLMNKIVQRFDPEIADWFRFKFLGLEEDSPTKTIARISQGINTYQSLNDARHEMDYDPVELGGSIPLAPQYLNALPQAYYQNEIAAFFSGNEARLTDPTLFYVKDPLYFQNLSMMQEVLKDKDKISNLLSSYLQELCNLYRKGN